MISPYLRLVPRTEQAARAGEKPQFAPARLAEPELPIERIRPDRRYVELERTPRIESWESTIENGFAFALVIGLIIWMFG